MTIFFWIVDPIIPVTMITPFPIVERDLRIRFDK